MRLVKFVEQGIDALTLVVCGRNEKHQSDFEVWDWDGVIRQYHRAIVNGRWSAVVGGGGSVGRTVVGGGRWRVGRRWLVAGGGSTGQWAAAGGGSMALIFYLPQSVGKMKNTFFC